MDRLGSAMTSNTSILYLGVVRNAFFFLIGIHIVACLWYSMGTLDHGWVDDRRAFFQKAGQSADGLHLYLTAFHWALSQVHGAADIYPVTEHEQAFATITLLAAFLVNTSFVASITNMVLQMENLFYERQKQERLVRGFLSENSISGALQERIRRHVHSYYSRKAQEEQQEMVLAHLSTNLVADLMTELRLPLLQTHPFFRQYTEGFPRGMAKLCQAFQVLSGVRGDTIFQASDVASAMYCVFKGELRYVPLVSPEVGRASAESARSAEEKKKAEAKRREDSRRSTSSRRSAASTRAQTRPGWKVSVNVFAEDSDSSDDALNCTFVKRGQLISEATLWMPWVHLGNLSTLGDDAQLLSIEPLEFEQLVVQNEDSYRLALSYAKVFKTAMQRSRGTDIVKQEFVEILLLSSGERAKSLYSSFSAMSGSQG